MNKIETWAYGLFGGAIGGGATAGGAWMGMAAAKAAGMDLPSLNFKAFGVIFLSSALVSALAYLSKSPLPALNGDTVISKKADTTPPAPPAP